jgi:hypothetical protein
MVEKVVVGRKGLSALSLTVDDTGNESNDEKKERQGKLWYIRVQVMSTSVRVSALSTK